MNIPLNPRHSFQFDWCSFWSSKQPCSALRLCCLRWILRNNLLLDLLYMYHPKMANSVGLYFICYCYTKNRLHKCGTYFAKLTVKALYNKYWKYELAYFLEVWNTILNLCLSSHSMSGWSWNQRLIDNGGCDVISCLIDNSWYTEYKEKLELTSIPILFL